MMMKKRSIFLPTMMLIMICLLATVAYFQYIWLGELSESEIDRMKAVLQNSAQRFAEDFDQELIKLQRSFHGIDPLSPDAAAMLHNSNQNWRRSEYSEILDDIFIIIPDQSGIKLEKWNSDSNQLETTRWSTELEDIRKMCEGAKSDIGGETFFAAINDLPALLIPGERSQHDLIPMEESGWILLTLNQKAIEEGLIGSLVNKYFTGRGEVLYDVAIINSSKPDKLLIASDSTLTQKEINPADATFDIFRSRFNNMLLQEVSVTDDKRKTKSAPSKQKTVLIHSMTKDSQFVQEKTIVEKSGRQTLKTLKLLPPRPAWKILFKHKSGSLETVVNQIRKRNLLVSFSILVLLAFAILLVMVEVRRTRKLANRQMNFVAGVSHELRTPLSVICSAAENLSDAIVDDPKQVQKYGQLMREEGRRLTEMIEQVLDFAGIHSDRTRQRGWIALEKLITKVVGDFTRLGYARIETDLPAGLPLVFADKVAIESAVRNLIDNAYKYAGDKTLIRIVARESNSPKNVSVRVIDQGPGISAEDLPHIFEPFYRGAGANQIRGTGLGLSLVNEVAESHGGRVAVETVAGKGSSFTLILPAKRNELERK